MRCVARKHSSQVEKVAFHRKIFLYGSSHTTKCNILKIVLEEFSMELKTARVGKKCSIILIYSSTEGSLILFSLRSMPKLITLSKFFHIAVNRLRRFLLIFGVNICMFSRKQYILEKTQLVSNWIVPLSGKIFRSLYSYKFYYLIEPVDILRGVKLSNLVRLYV